jgi:hypothetical protein
MSGFSDWRRRRIGEQEFELDVRLPESVIAEIDDACEVLRGGMDRAVFVRYAVWFALDSIANERTGWLEETTP